MLYTPDREHFGIVPVEAMYVSPQGGWKEITQTLIQAGYDPRPTFTPENERFDARNEMK